jgi:hypothetical protein
MIRHQPKAKLGRDKPTKQHLSQIHFPLSHIGPKGETMEQAVVCEQCRIRNPAGRKTCVNCGALLPKVDRVVSGEVAWKPKPIKPVPIPDDPASRDYRLYKEYGILPGRPIWIAGYALLLALGAILLIVAVSVRVLTGSLMETYSSFLPVVGFVVLAIVAMTAAVGLWKMENRGRILLLVLQIIWLVAATLIVYGTFNAFPWTMRSEFFGRLTLDEATVTAAASLAALILIPTLFGLYLLRYWSFTWLMMGGLGTVISGLLLLVVVVAVAIGGLWMFIAAPIVLFDPSLFTRINPDTSVPGLLRLGFVVSIPINLLAIIGLVIERPRFK